MTMAKAFNHGRGTAAERCANCGTAINQNALILWSRTQLPASVALH
jgi:hypothetical protein